MSALASEVKSSGRIIEWVREAELALQVLVHQNKTGVYLSTLVRLFWELSSAQITEVATAFASNHNIQQIRTITIKADPTEDQHGYTSVLAINASYLQEYKELHPELNIVDDSLFCIGPEEKSTDDVILSAGRLNKQVEYSLHDQRIISHRRYIPDLSDYRIRIREAILIEMARHSGDGDTADRVKSLRAELLAKPHEWLEYWTVAFGIHRVSATRQCMFWAALAVHINIKRVNLTTYDSTPPPVDLDETEQEVALIEELNDSVVGTAPEKEDSTTWDPVMRVLKKIQGAELRKGSELLRSSRLPLLLTLLEL